MPLEQDKSGGVAFKLDEVINSGIYPDVFASRIPLWEYGENIEFSEFGVEKARGRATLVDTANGEPIRGLMQQTRSDTGDFLIHCGDLSTLYEYNVTTGTLTTRGTGYNLAADAGSALWDGGTSDWDGGVSLWDDGITPANQWSFVNYGTFILATNGIDFPQIYKPSVGPNYGDLVGTDLGVGGTVEIFVNRGPHILGFNTNISDKEFIWCDADNPDDWVAAADNLAGQLEIRELKTQIKAAVPLGGRIAVYGEDQMFLVNYLANDLVFGYQPGLNGIGAVSKNAVVPVGRKNFGLSHQGFFVTDGSSFDYIDEPAMRHWFQNNVNSNQTDKVVGYHDEDNNQVRWYFPSDTTMNSLAVSYNYLRGVWSFITGAVSAAEERNVAKFPVGGTESGVLVVEGSGANDQETAMVSYVLSKPLDVGDPDKVKELTSIRIGFRTEAASSGLKFDIGWSETENGPVTWTTVDNLVDPGFEEHHLRTAGRWLYIKLHSDKLNANWEVMSVDVIARIEGTR